MGGGGTNEVKNKQESSPWKEQIPFLKYGMDEAARLYQEASPTYYPGSTIAPFSTEQNQAMDLTKARAMGGNQTMRQAEGYARDVLGGKYSGDPYEGQVFQNIQQRVLPSVNSQFMGSGRYGSGMQADSAARGLTEAFAPYASSMYQQGLSRMDQAASMAPIFAQNDYTDISALGAMGQQRQALAQDEMNDARARYDFYQELPYNKLGQYFNNIGGNYGGTVIGTSKTQTPSMFSQVAGAGVGLLGSAISGGMFSDRRLKEGIKRVGHLDDGTPVYSYRYKFGGPVHIGVMAQDIKDTHPNAVSVHASGFKIVDYGRLAAEIGG